MRLSNPGIYLDYHATTPVDPRVAQLVLRYMTTQFGNAHSVDHAFGDAAALAIDVAASQVSELVGAEPSQIVFTSGATEAINLAIQGFAAARRAPLRVAVSPTEHAAVLETCEALSRADHARVRTLHVDSDGRIDLEEVERVCRDGIDLLCVMAANNEVGTIAPIDRVGAIAAEHGVAYLCDATQACGRIRLRFRDSGIAFLVLSAHKMHGPKGVGALVLLSKRLIAPVLHGGHHQSGIRPGTLNVPGIAALGLASELRRVEMDIDEPAICERRDRLQSLLISGIGDAIRVNGDQTARLAGNLHVSFLRCPNSAIIARVRDHVAIATGAACSSGIEAPSHVLRAMGLPNSVLEGALRIGLGKWTSDSEVDRAAELLVNAAHDVLKVTSGGSASLTVRSS